MIIFKTRGSAWHALVRLPVVAPDHGGAAKSVSAENNFGRRDASSGSWLWREGTPKRFDQLQDVWWPSNSHLTPRRARRPIVQKKGSYVATQIFPRSDDHKQRMGGGRVAKSMPLNEGKRCSTTSF